MISSTEAQRFHSEVKAVREDLEKNVKQSKEHFNQQQLEQSIFTFEESLNVQAQSNNGTPRIFLLEVYASANSPLTEAVQNLGYKAMRFT